MDGRQLQPKKPLHAPYTTPGRTAGTTTTVGSCAGGGPALPPSLDPSSLRGSSSSQSAPRTWRACWVCAVGRRRRGERDRRVGSTLSLRTSPVAGRRHVDGGGDQAGETDPCGSREQVQSEDICPGGAGCTAFGARRPLARLRLCRAASAANSPLQGTDSMQQGNLAHEKLSVKCMKVIAENFARECPSRRPPPPRGLTRGPRRAQSTQSWTNSMPASRPW